MALEELYREVILDHYRNPRNRTPLDHPDLEAEGVNPLCGDTLTVYLRFKSDRIRDAAFQCTCCGVSMASASVKALHGVAMLNVWPFNTCLNCSPSALTPT